MGDELPSPLSTIGEEIVRIITPVSTCMLIVVLLVSSLSSSSSSLLSSSSSSSASASPSSSFWSDLEPALLTSLTFVIAVTFATFVVLLLFYLRCTPCLKSYLAFSAFLVPFVLGGQVLLALSSALSLPIDLPTFSLLLLNLSVLASLSTSSHSLPISLSQSFLVAIASLVAYSFTALPEWTTWALLVALSLYDLAAVLLPVGPLRLLVELAVSRDEDLPALVYEARPVHSPPPPPPPDPPASLGAFLLGDDGARRAQQHEGEEEEVEVEEDMERIGLGSTGAIKLGLGDFIFYSVLVGRAAMYDYLTVYACYLAIIAGLGITLLLLAFYRKALPALPVSIALGVTFYLVTRTLLEVFVLQCSANLVMF